MPTFPHPPPPVPDGLLLDHASLAGGLLEARAVAVEGGAVVDLRTRDDRWRRVELRWQPALEVVTTSSASARRIESTWTMTRGVVPHVARDGLGKAMRWASNRVWLARRGEPAQVVVAEEHPELLRALFRVAGAAARAAVGGLAPSAHRLALRFLPHLRMRAYARLAADSTGRLADLVSACPGALIFAFALLERDLSPASEAAGERLLADVVAGRKLTHALDAAIAAWLDAAPDYLAALDARSGLVACDDAAAPGEPAACDAHDLDPALDGDRASLAELHVVWAHALDPAARAQVLAAQRVLIRRAGPQVITKHLWMPPPVMLVPDDIPANTRANARWYRSIKLSPITMRWIDGVGRDHQRALAAFVSRHGAEMARGYRLTQLGRMRDLLDYARATGRWPARTMPLARVLTEVELWHAALYERAGAAPVGWTGAVDLELPLVAPAAAVLALRLAGVELTPLRTAGELVAEGVEMGHCVATRLEAALEGAALVFRGVVERERVTVELARHGGRWLLGDHRCVRNRSPRPPTAAAIGRWASAAVTLQQAAELPPPRLLSPPAAPGRLDHAGCPF